MLKKEETRDLKILTFILFGLLEFVNFIKFINFIINAWTHLAQTLTL